MTQEQRVINELLKEISEIQGIAYHAGSMGQSFGDKIDIKCGQVLSKYEGFKVSNNKQEHAKSREE